MITMEQGGVEMLQLVFLNFAIDIKDKEPNIYMASLMFQLFSSHLHKNLEICSGIPTVVYVTLSPFPLFFFPLYISQRT